MCQREPLFVHVHIPVMDLHMVLLSPAAPLAFSACHRQENLNGQDILLPLLLLLLDTDSQSVSQSGSRRRTMEMPPCSVYKRYNVESQDGCCGNAAPISMQCNLSGWEPLCRARFSLNGPVQGVSYVRGGRRVPPTHNGFESRWL